jgi:hypothetical protein
VKRSEIFSHRDHFVAINFFSDLIFVLLCLPGSDVVSRQSNKKKYIDLLVLCYSRISFIKKLIRDLRQEKSTIKSILFFLLDPRTRQGQAKRTTYITFSQILITYIHIHSGLCTYINTIFSKSIYNAITTTFCYYWDGWIMAVELPLLIESFAPN